MECLRCFFTRPTRREHDTMNRGNMFNRRMRQWHDSADHLQSAVRDGASSLADQTRDGLAKGQKLMDGWERTLEGSVRAKPMLFLGITAAIIALTGLLTGLMLSRKK